MGLLRRSVRIKIVLLILMPVLSLAGLYEVRHRAHRRRRAAARVGPHHRGRHRRPGRLTAQIGAERQLAVVLPGVPTARNLALLRQTGNRPALRPAIAGPAITRPGAINACASLITAAAPVLNQAILQQSNVPPATQALAFVRMESRRNICCRRTRCRPAISLRGISPVRRPAAAPENKVIAELTVPAAHRRSEGPAT